MTNRNVDYLDGCLFVPDHDRGDPRNPLSVMRVPIWPIPVVITPLLDPVNPTFMNLVLLDL